VSCFVPLRTAILISGALAASSLAAVSEAHAADDLMRLRLKIFFKTMTYDHNFPVDAPTVRVGLVIPRAQAEAKEVAETRALFSSFAETKVKGRPFEVIELVYDRADDLERAVHGQRLYALFLTAPVPPPDVAGVARAAVKERLLTFAESPALVDLGIGVAVEVVGDRPQLVINHAVTKTAGRDLSSSLLELARIVQ
jgi:hypothetical protein